MDELAPWDLNCEEDYGDGERQFKDDESDKITIENKGERESFTVLWLNNSKFSGTKFYYFPRTSLEWIGNGKKEKQSHSPTVPREEMFFYEWWYE